MAPARGKERFNRCAPERSRALNYSCNVNGFKSITSQSSSMFPTYLLFCFFFLLSSNCVSHTYAQSMSLSARDNVECTYANSTCSSCNVLCLHGEFYPLFPSSCHPSYEGLTHSSESFPGRTSTSFRFPGGNSYSVPADLLPPFSGLNNFTIAVYFRELQATNSTLFRLKTDSEELTFQYTTARSIEIISEGKTEMIATYNSSLVEEWKSVYFTFVRTQSGMLDTVTISTHIGNEPTNVILTDVPFDTTTTSVTIGEGFNGTLQDIRVYSPVLETTEGSQIIVPQEASFLPQCLCPSGSLISEGEAECTMADQSLQMRYSTSATPAEFATDTSTSTLWRSSDSITLASLVIGLEAPVSLSKIFVSFGTSLPEITTLEYYNEQVSTWRTLQQFSIDCNEFGVGGKLEQSTGVICLPYTGTSSLAFFLAGSDDNMRPPPTEDEQSFEVYYNASRVRIVVNGLVDPATSFSISDVEICPEFCFDLEPSCTSSCGEGSGMFMSDVLAPSSPSAFSSLFSVPTSSSMDTTNQVNSNTLISIARSTSEAVAATSFTNVMPLTTTNLDFFTTMTFMSSSTTGIDATMEITSTQLLIDQPVTTFMSNQVMITSSFVEGIGVSSSSALSSSVPIVPSVMTSAVFDVSTTSIAMSVDAAVSSTTEAASTSQFRTGALPSSSLFLLPTPTPAITAAESSTQEEASLSTTMVNQATSTLAVSQPVELTSSASLLATTTFQEVITSIAQEPTVSASTTEDVEGAVSTPAPATSLADFTTIPFSAPVTSLMVSMQDLMTSTSVVQLSSTDVPSSSLEVERTSSANIFSTPVMSLSSTTTLASSSTLELQPTPSSTILEPIVSSSSSVVEPSQASSSIEDIVDTTPEPSVSASRLESSLVSTPESSSFAVDNEIPTSTSFSSFSLTPTPDMISPSMTQVSTEPSASSSRLESSLVSTPESSSFAVDSEIPTSTSFSSFSLTPTPDMISPSMTQVSTEPSASSSRLESSLVSTPESSSFAVDSEIPTSISFTSFSLTPTPDMISPSMTPVNTEGAESSLIEQIQTSFVSSSTPIFSPSQSLEESTATQTQRITSENPTSTPSAFITVSDTTVAPSLTSLELVLPTSDQVTSFEPSIVDMPPSPTFVQSFSLTQVQPTPSSSSPSEAQPTSIPPVTDTNSFAISPSLLTPPVTISMITTAVQTTFVSPTMSVPTVLQPESETVLLPSISETPTLTLTPASSFVPSATTTAATMVISMSRETTSNIAPEVTASPTSTESISQTSQFRSLTSSAEFESSVPTPSSASVMTNIVSSTPEIFMSVGSGFGSGDFDTSMLFPETSEIAPTPTTTLVSISQPGPSSSLSVSEGVISSETIVTSTPIRSFSFPSFTIEVTTTGQFQPSQSLTETTSEVVTPTGAVVSTVLSVTPNITPSSAVVSTGTFSPSPSPTPAVSPTPVALPLCEVPLAPIQVDTDGLGFILSEDVSPDESDANGLTYSVELGQSIGRSDQLTSSGSLTASLGDFTGQSAPYTLNEYPIAHLNGFISNEQVWPDGPSISVAFQVRDSSFSSNVNVDVDCEVVLNNMRDASTNTTECFVSPLCGTSSVNLDIPSNWFLEYEVTNVAIEVMIGNRRFELGSTVLMPTDQTQIDNTVFMIPPKRSLLPGEEFRVPIHASFSRRLAGFSLDCQVNGEAAELRGAESTFTWSLLSSVHPNDTNRMSLTGFRSYDRTNTSQISSTEVIVELIIAVRPNSQLVEESKIEIQCETLKLVLTTGDDLVEKESIKYVRALNRDGESTMMGIGYLETRTYIGLFACTNQNEIVNTARLTSSNTMMIDTVNMSVYGFSIDNGNLDRLSQGVMCASDNESVIEVDMMCAHVYFDGTELYGSDKVDIWMVYTDGEASGSIPFRVWLPSQEINISLADSELNAIESTATCENGSTTYQRSSLTIMTTISTGTETAMVHVTSLLRPYLRVSDDNIAQLTDSMLYVEGVSDGETFLYVSTLGQEYGAEISVTNATVEAECFNIFTFTSIDVTLSLPDKANDFRRMATISLSENYEFIGSNFYIVPVIQFSDDARMVLTEEQFDSLEIAINPELEDNLERTSAWSEGSFEITSPIDDFDITVVWTIDSLQECEYVAFTSNYSFNNGGDIEIPSLIINATSDTITSPDDAAAYLGTPTFILLEAYLGYNTFESNITGHNGILFEVINDPLNLLRLTDYMGRTRMVETNSSNSGVATIRATFSPLNITTEYSITVKRRVSFVLTAYKEGGADIITSQLGQIGSSGKYQRAELGARINFSDGTMKQLSNDDITVTIVSNDPDVVGIVQPPSKILQVNDAPSSEVIVSLQAVIVGSNITSDYLNVTIQSSSESIEVISINSVSLSKTAAKLDDIIYADCAVELADGTYLSTTFTDGTPIYRDLITFSSLNLEFLSVSDPAMGRLSLIKNSLEPLQLKASAGNVSRTETFIGSLNPNLEEVGLKMNAIQITEQDNFNISVVLNSDQRAVGVYEVEVMYKSASQLQLIEIVQGDNWKNGTVIFAEKSGGRVTIGGVLNRGIQNSLAELAVLTFMALEAGTVAFNVTVNYISDANVIPTVLTSPSNSLAGHIQINIASSEPSKREAPYFYYDYDFSDLDDIPWPDLPIPHHSRSKRDTLTCTPSATDVNGDCVENLIDVYVLQEFISAEVYDFATAEGQQLTQMNITTANVGEGDISQIFAIERTSLDLSFNVFNLSYTFDLQDNSDICRFFVSGAVESTSDATLNFNDINNLVYVFLDFASTNETFQSEFDSTFGDNAISPKNGVNGLYGGTVNVPLTNDMGSAIFEIQVNSSFKTEGFTMVVFLSILTDIQVEDQIPTIGSFGIDIVSNITVTGAIDSCIPVPTTSAVLPTSTAIEDLTSTEFPVLPTTTAPSTSEIPSTVVVLTSVEPPVVSTTIPLSSTVVLQVTSQPTVDGSPTSDILSNTVAPTSTEELLTMFSSLVVMTSSTLETPTTTSSTAVLSSSEIISPTTFLVFTPSPTPIEPEVPPTSSELLSTSTELPTSTAQPVSTSAIELVRSSTATMVPSPSPPPVPTTIVQPSSSARDQPTTTTDLRVFISTTATDFVQSTTTTAPVESPTPTPPLTTTQTTEPSSTSVQPQSTTTSVVPPTTEVTTEPTTTEIVTEPTTTEIVTEPTTTEIVTEPTTTEIVTEPTTTEIVTEPTTTEIVTEPTTTEIVTEPTTTEIVTEPTTTEIVTEPTTTEIVTEPTTTEIVTEPTTTDTVTEPTTTEIVTEPTTTEIVTESSTTEIITEPTTTEIVTESTTTEIITEPTTTKIVTEPPTTKMTTDMTTDTTTRTTTDVGSTVSAKSEDGPTTIIIVVIAVIAVILAIVVVVFIVVYAVKKHRKKSGIYRPHSNHNTPSRGNKGFFFHEEEQIEMNPINCDLVPMDPIHSGHFFMETGAESMNLVPNHHIYHGDTNTGDDIIMSGSSMKPLIREPPEPGRQASMRGKLSFTNYSESTLDHPPPPYHATGTTITGTTLSSKSGNSTSPYDIEDDYFDLPFNDDPTQAYLSLGLTPLSQLSPPDHAGSGSDGNNFFPSMPPPVMPSAFNSGIPVDSPFNISGSSSGGMVMPNAFPSMTDQPRKSSSGRRNRHDHNPLSQGYPIKLAPVPEQSDPIDDSYSQVYNGRRHRHAMFNGRDESSSSESNDESSNLMMFPSADVDSSSNSQLQRQRGKRRASGTRRIDNGWSQTSQDDVIFSNNGALFDDVPERDVPSYVAQGSPRQKGRFLRNQAREQELKRQKELLRRKAEEDERRRILQQEHRAAKIARDYGSMKYREVDIDEQVQQSQNSGRVLKEAMKFEAHMQLMQERGMVGSQSPGGNYPERMSQEKRLVSPQRQSSYGRIINSYDQFTTI